MAEYKKQHIIAENYLKGFSKIDYFRSDERNFPVWIYNLQEKTLKLRSPHNIAWRPDYYSSVDKNGKYQHALEKEFSQLECMINLLFRRIDSNIRDIRRKKEIEPLTEDDRILMIHFIFWHMKKVPSVVDRVHREVKEMFSQLTTKYGATFSEAEVKNKTLELIVGIGTGKAFDFVKALLDKNFRIAFLSSDESSFITTDNPVVRFNITDTDGIGLDSTEIYFPISQRCLALLFDKGNRFEYQILSDRKRIFQLNKFIASKAKYFIISRDKEYIVKILEELGYGF